MARPLDPGAPSLAAEMRRFLDGDYLGKLIFRSLLEGACGYEEDSQAIQIPLGRYGRLGEDSHSLYDAHIQHQGSDLAVELKLARINIRDAKRGNTNYNWAFNNLLRTPGRKQKSYDLAVCIGIQELGPDNPDYWNFEARLRAARVPGVGASPGTLPYLGRCGFFIFAFQEVPSNFLSSHLDLAHQGAHARFFSWGHDRDRCRRIWENAVAGAMQRRQGEAPPTR